MQDTGKYYLINHLVLFTGLTDRTIRNYISNGILQGEKINGLWHFTPEQAEDFIQHPAVRPSILAKNNCIIYDFLLANAKKEPEACMILDLPDVEKKSICEFFCYEISNGDYKNLRFSYDGVGKAPRVILKGDVSSVLKLVNDFNRKQPGNQSLKTDN